MLKIAVCDDEIQAAKNIKRIVQEFCKEKERESCVDLFMSGRDFVKLEEEMLNYHIVFLDINMEELDGIETALKLRELSERVVVIFVTAFIEYTLAGYKVEALRYILKTDLNFEIAIYESLEAALKKLDSRLDLVMIPFQTGIKSVARSKIVYIESNLHNLNFYICEDAIKKYVLRGTMANVKQYIKDEKMLRIHQSYIVNLDFCDRIYYNRMVLHNGIELPVSKSYSKMARDIFYQYKGDV